MVEHYGICLQHRFLSLGRVRQLEAVRLRTPAEKIELCNNAAAGLGFLTTLVPPFTPQTQTTIRSCSLSCLRTYGDRSVRTSDAIRTSSRERIRKLHRDQPSPERRCPRAPVETNPGRVHPIRRSSMANCNMMIHPLPPSKDLDSVGMAKSP